MKFLSILIMLSVSFLWCEDNVDLPKQANDIIIKLDSDIIELKRKAIVSLEKVKVDQTKKGNLKSAMSIDELIVSYKAEIPPDDLLLNQSNEYIFMAKCDNEAIVYLNGKKLLSCSDKVETVKMKLSGKVIITAKCNNTGGAKGFSLVMKSRDGKVIISTNDEASWKSYTPKSEDKWFSTELIGKLSGVVEASTPWRIDDTINPIWSENKTNTCYLVYGVK